MRLREVMAVVLVQDMERALHFYRDLLGFTPKLEQEDWATFEEGIGLMLSPEPFPEMNVSLNAITVALSVEDAHAAYHELTEQGVAFLVGPTDVGGAIVASFRDSEGNLLQLLQTLVT